MVTNSAVIAGLDRAIQHAATDLGALTLVVTGCPFAFTGHDDEE